MPSGIEQDELSPAIPIIPIDPILEAPNLRSTKSLIRPDSSSLTKTISRKLLIVDDNAQGYRLTSTKNITLQENFPPSATSSP